MIGRVAPGYGPVSAGRRAGLDERASIIFSTRVTIAKLAKKPVGKIRFIVTEVCRLLQKPGDLAEEFFGPIRLANETAVVSDLVFGRLHLAGGND